MEGSKNGRLDQVILALKNGADIHTDNDYALRWASKNGHLEVVKYLVEMELIFMLMNDFSSELWASRERTFGSG